MDDPSKLRSAKNRMKGPLLDDGLGDTFRPSLFAIFEKDSFDLPLRKAVDEICGCPSRSSIHSHIQETFLLKAETSFSPFELKGTESQIEKNPVDSFHLQRPEDLGQGGEVLSKKLHPVAKPRKNLSRLVKGLVVPFDSDQHAIGSGSCENLAGMAATAEGGIHIGLVGLASQT